MSQDHLGLFDTPPSRNQLRSSMAIVGLLLAVLVAILTLPEIPLGQVNAFIPMINTATALIDLIIAALLFGQASVFRSRALSALGAGYVFTGLILIPHALTFPGAFAPDGLLGAGVSSTAWIYIFWRLGFPIAVILYVIFGRSETAVPPGRERPTAGVAVAVFVAVVLAAGSAMLATLGHDLLPSLYLNRSLSNYPNMIRASSAVILLAITSMFVLFRQRKSVLDIWLLVVMSAWLVQTLLFLSLEGRFTVSWYFTDVVVLLSHLFLMLAMITESNRLYARLALSTAARNREREARLMSMDAVTAAISHEVGQPLTAVSLNASAGLNWLTRERPDVKKAIISLRAISEAGQRTFDVIKSIRAMFAKEAGQATEFSLNDLVLETASLLDRELAASKISLQLALEDGLPPIRADRVQMQRVLVNLVTNAIESLREVPDRPRRVAIASALLDGKDVLLQVGDNGAGIAPEEIDHIFDPFVTTKATGTGLGLPLCRTIVEDHGGRLWASQGEPHGAAFHLRLPRSGAVAVASEETDELLSNLEGSLRWLRRTKSDEVTDVIAELQHIVDEVRDTMRNSER